MFRGVKKAVPVFMAAACASLLHFGCSNDEGPTQNTSVTANLVVFFEPNPAPVTDYGEYQTLLCVGETNGIGLYVHGVVEQQYSASGEPYSPKTYDDLWFKRKFQVDPTEGAYLPGGEGRCTHLTYNDFDYDRYEDWTFLGEDDLGNEVSGTGRIYLGAAH